MTVGLVITAITAETAKDLRGRLEGEDLDPDTRLSLLIALDRVAGRLDAAAAAETAKDLRGRLEGKDLDPVTRRSLIEALGGVCAAGCGCGGGDGEGPAWPAGGQGPRS